MSQMNNFDTNSGNLINVLKQCNLESIDRNFFVPLYYHLIKSHLDKSVIIQRIDTSDIPNNIKKIDHRIFQLGKIWEEYVQTEIRKFMTVNPYLEYFDIQQDQKRFVSMQNGSLLIRKNNKTIVEFDNVLLYHNQHPIIIEIKSSTGKGSGTAFGSGHYKSKMKIVKEFFSDYDEPFFLKIRASKNNEDIELTSRFRDHRKIIMNHSPMLTDLKHRSLRVRFR